MRLKTVYPLILKDGLRNYKFRNSHLKPVSSAEEGKRGAIFAYRSKAHMIKARGLVLTSMEAIKENKIASLIGRRTFTASDHTVTIDDKLHVAMLKRICVRSIPL